MNYEEICSVLRLKFRRQALQTGALYMIIKITARIEGIIIFVRIYLQSFGTFAILWYPM